MDRLATVFVLSKEIRVHVCATLDLLPGEKRVVSRNHIPHGEPAQLIRDRLPIIVRLTTLLSIRDQHYRSAGRGLFVSPHGAVNSPSAGTQHQLKSSWRMPSTDGDADLERIRRSARLEIETRGHRLKINPVA